MTDNTDDSHQNPTKAKARRDGAKRNRNSVAALKVVTLDGIPVRDNRSKTTEATRTKVLESGETVGHNLTAKQESFAQHVAKGSTLTDAYKASYDTSGYKPETIHRQAFSLNTNPKIAARIQSIRDGMKPKRQHEPGEVKAQIISALMRIMNDPKSRPADISKAAELLGKWSEIALFEERSVIKTETTSVDDAVTQLQEKLAKLKAG